MGGCRTTANPVQISFLVRCRRTLAQRQPAAPTLPAAKIVRRKLAAVRLLPGYAGKPALAALTHNAAEQLRKQTSLYRDALAELTATVGAEHQLSVDVALNKGVCLHLLSQPREALPLLESVLAAKTRQLGEEHWTALRALHMVSNVRHELGDLDGPE